MKFSTNKSECEICHKPRGRGGHPICSKKKQQMSAASAKKKTTSATYDNPRKLSGFLKVIGS
jgi:hypothetical protein